MNLIVDPEPYYDVLIVWGDSARGPEILGRWKRVTAICHARRYAHRFPDATVCVQLANSC